MIAKYARLTKFIFTSTTNYYHKDPIGKLFDEFFELIIIIEWIGGDHKGTNSKRFQSERLSVRNAGTFYNILRVLLAN